MFFVFGSFVLGPEVALKLMGLGLAVAVLIDATIVRMVLVPATMELLGDWNWWLPKWLDRILPRVHVEGGTRWRRSWPSSRLSRSRRARARGSGAAATPDQISSTTPKGHAPERKPYDAREHAAQREQQHELPTAPFERVHHHHEGHGTDAVDRDRHGASVVEG